MVKGFKDEDGKFIPTDRSPVSPKLTVRELLPKTEKDEDLERQSKRLGKFALKRAKEFGKGAKIVGGAIVGGAKFGKQKGEERKQRKIEKQITEQKFDEMLEKGVDDIIDERGASDSRKFRRLQRFGVLNRKLLSKTDLKLLNDTLKELDERIQRSRRGEKKETGGLTQERKEMAMPTAEGISAEQFEKLPQTVKEQIRLQVGG